jgi:hypothetical protein
VAGDPGSRQEAFGQDSVGCWVGRLLAQPTKMLERNCFDDVGYIVEVVIYKLNFKVRFT